MMSSNRNLSYHHYHHHHRIRLLSATTRN